MPRKSAIKSLADLDGAPQGAAAVDRALSLLRVFKAGDKGLTLTDLSSRTDLYKSTVLRMLASLIHAGLVAKDEESGSYGLGPEIARLHAIYTASFSLGAVVMPALRELVSRTEESAAFHTWHKQGTALVRVCDFRVDSPHSLRDHVRAGDVLSGDKGAGARVLIAFTPRHPLLNSSPRDRTLYRKIRKDGFAALVGDREPELGGISAPVFRLDGSLAGALTVTMPAHRYDASHIELVINAAKKLSGLM